jgi:hypothetical protein
MMQAGRPRSSSKCPCVLLSCYCCCVVLTSQLIMAGWFWDEFEGESLSDEADLPSLATCNTPAEGDLLDPVHEFPHVTIGDTRDIASGTGSPWTDELDRYDYAGTRRANLHPALTHLHQCEQRPVIPVPTAKSTGTGVEKRFIPTPICLLSVLRASVYCRSRKYIWLWETGGAKGPVVTPVTSVYLPSTVGALWSWKLPSQFKTGVPLVCAT